MDFRFMGGSLGAAVGELITLAAETALVKRTPLLLVTASGGARMQEGALALMQMAKTSQALRQLDEAGILTISLITDPTYGGVAASFATLSDVIVAEPGARLGFAGPRVIAQTIRQTLPAGFQTAELLLSQGLIDAIHPRHGLRQALGRLLSVGTRRGGDTASPAADVVITDPAQLPEVPAWEAVQRARNHGMPMPSGYRKAARLARLAAKLGLPVITFVDTPGAYPGVQAEEQGQSIAIAELIRLMSGLTVPVITVISGEGGSGGALALAVADRVFVCANGTYSVISPEGCAAILWNDPAAAPRAAEALHLDARQLLAEGIVDGVVPEPPGGTQSDHVLAAELVHDALVTTLRELSAAEPGQLVASRHDRFRRFGADLVSTKEDWK